MQSIKLRTLHAFYCLALCVSQAGAETVTHALSGAVTSVDLELQSEFAVDEPVRLLLSFDTGAIDGDPAGNTATYQSGIERASGRIGDYEFTSSSGSISLRNNINGTDADSVQFVDLFHGEPVGGLDPFTFGGLILRPGGGLIGSPSLADLPPTNVGDADTRQVTISFGRPGVGFKTVGVRIDSWSVPEPGSSLLCLASTSFAVLTRRRGH